MSAKEVRYCDHCGIEKPAMVDPMWLFMQGAILIQEKGNKATQFQAQQDFCSVSCLTKKLLKTLSVADVMRDDANEVERAVRAGKPTLTDGEVSNLRLPSK